MGVGLAGWLLLLAILFGAVLVPPELRPQFAALALAGFAFALCRRWIRLGRRRRRRSRRRASSARRPIPAKTRQQIYARDGHACLYCGRRRGPTVALHLDHLYPYSLGGTDHPENLVTACADCNRSKGATVFRTERDLERFAARRQTWAADHARQNRRPLPVWRLLLAAALLLAVVALSTFR